MFSSNLQPILLKHKTNIIIKKKKKSWNLGMTRGRQGGRTKIFDKVDTIKSHERGYLD